MISKYTTNFTQFDTVTNFRILNRFLVTLGLSILVPITIDLKGELLAPYIISILLLAETLAVKAHKTLVKLKLSTLYKLGTSVHFLLFFIIVLYFYNTLYFIIAISIFTIVEIAVFGAFSIELDVYQSKHFHSQVQRFKVVRNSISADATIVGLSTSTLLTFFNPTLAVITTLAIHGVFAFYFIKNWHFIERNSLDEKVINDKSL